MRFIDDFVFAEDVRPGRSRQEQVDNGFRLGIGAGAFLIALMLLGSGLTRMVSPTAQVWLLVVGGYALFGVVKGVLVLVTGKVLYTYQRVPRLEAAEATIFALATLLLLFRFYDTRPNILDRVALTFYVFAVAWSGHSAASTLVDPRLAAGLIGLAISWCVYRWKRAKFQGTETLSSR